MIVDSAVYVNGHRYAGDIPLQETYEASRKQGCFAWIDLHEPTEEEFDSVRREFGLHELAVEDAIKAHQRPKLEVYGDSLFLVLKTARLEDIDLVLGDVLLFVGDDFIISVRHGQTDLTDLHGVRLQLEGRPDLLGHGPTAAMYGILDGVGDDYLPAIEEVDLRIQELEREVFSPSRENPAEQIYRLKRTVLELHEALVPLEGPVDDLARGLYTIVPETMQPYFRDVHDHLVRGIGRVTEFRELLTSVLTANLTQASFRQNEDVRTISAWAAIIAVPTAVAGIYGMNFEHMPELEWTFGYPLVLAVIAAVCLLLYWRFRRVGWL